MAFGGVSAASLLLPQATEPFPSQRGACSFVPALRFVCEGICKNPRILLLVGHISTKTLERDVDPISLIGEPFGASARGFVVQKLPLRGVTGIANDPLAHTMTRVAGRRELDSSLVTTTSNNYRPFVKTGYYSQVSFSRGVPARRQFLGRHLNL